MVDPYRFLTAAHSAITVRRALVILWLGLAGAAAQASAAEAIHVGPELQRELRKPVDLLWSGRELREALHSLSRSTRVAVLIDRRVDPGQQLDIRIQGRPLGESFEAIAAARQLGFCWYGPVAYFGPAETAERLRTLGAVRREEIAGMAPLIQRAWLRTRSLAWDDFASPRELLAQLASEAQARFSNLEQVPHDLWAAAQLPPLTLADRVTLVAAQFDLTFRFAAPAVLTLEPIAKEIAIERRYHGGPSPTLAAAQLRQLAPRASIHVDGARLVVRGRLEDHEQIAAGPPVVLAADARSAPPRAELGKANQGPAPASPPSAAAHSALGNADPFALKRFTLTVAEQPAGAILGALARRMGLELAVDEAVREDPARPLEKRIAVSVSEATADELLSAACSAAGLECHREGARVRVSLP
ncbi:MAG: hypothetical protein ACOY3P_15750 [Planctomycetota bacterium]